MATAVTPCQMASDLCAQSGSHFLPFAVDIDDAERGGPAVSINKPLSSQSQYSDVFPVPLPPVKEDEIEVQNVRVMDIGRDSKEQRMEEEMIELEELENSLLEVGKVLLTTKHTPSTFSIESAHNDTQEETANQTSPNNPGGNKSAENNGYERIIDRSYGSYPQGWSQLSSFLNSSTSTAIWRRFGIVHTRVLLHRQVSITDLEKRLEALDHDDAKHEHMEYRQRGNVLKEGDDTTKQDLIEEMGKQVSEYDDLLLKYHKILALEPVPRRDWLSVFTWIFNNKPLYNGTYDFIYHRDDFVSIANHCRNGFDEFIETCYFLRDKEPAPDAEVTYFPRSKVTLAAKLLAVCVEVVALLTPIFLLALVKMSMVVTLVVVLLFVLTFATIMSLSTGAKADAVFIGTCTYAAILVVFLANIQEKAMA